MQEHARGMQGQGGPTSNTQDPHLDHQAQLEGVGAPPRPAALAVPLLDELQRWVQGRGLQGRELEGRGQAARSSAAELSDQG